MIQLSKIYRLFCPRKYEEKELHFLDLDTQMVAMLLELLEIESQTDIFQRRIDDLDKKIRELRSQHKDSPWIQFGHTKPLYDEIYHLHRLIVNSYIKRREIDDKFYKLNKSYNILDPDPSKMQTHYTALMCALTNSDPDLVQIYLRKLGYIK